jgi:hypothetical protein
MLLSQQAQSMLGFKKDVRDGTIQLKDYANQDLEVVRQERTVHDSHGSQRSLQVRRIVARFAES